MTMVCCRWTDACYSRRRSASRHSRRPPPAPPPTPGSSPPPTWKTLLTNQSWAPLTCPPPPGPPTARSPPRQCRCPRSRTRWNVSVRLSLSGWTVWWLWPHFPALTRLTVSSHSVYGPLSRSLCVARYKNRDCLFCKTPQDTGQLQYLQVGTERDVNINYRAFCQQFCWAASQIRTCQAKNASTMTWCLLWCYDGNFNWLFLYSQIVI